MGHGELSLKIQKCPILGVDISVITMRQLVEILKDNYQKMNGEYICVANVHTTVYAFDNPSYLNVQNGSVLTIPDGGPLSSLARRRGYSDIERTTGPSLMGEVFQISAEQHMRHFFYGSTEETLKKMKENIEKAYPGMEIVGLYSPPFRSLTKEEDDHIIEMINQIEPDFVWVGLGAPKQEIWMAEHKGKINGVMVGVGAGFDYYAGNIKRAPEWMQNHNLEWLYRLLQDPKRLLKRYLYTNSKFILQAVILGK